MARPTFDLNPGSFTFDNGPVTIVGQTEIVPSPTVESVTLTNHHGEVALGITDLVVPPHLFTYWASLFRRLNVWDYSEA